MAGGVLQILGTTQLQPTWIGLRCELLLRGTSGTSLYAMQTPGLSLRSVTVHQLLRGPSEEDLEDERNMSNYFQLHFISIPTMCER